MANAAAKQIYNPHIEMSLVSPPSPSPRLAPSSFLFRSLVQLFFCFNCKQGKLIFNFRTIFRNNDIGVAAAVRMYVINGLVQAGHNFDAALQSAVLVPQALRRRRAEGQLLIQSGSCVDLDALPLQHVADVVEDVAAHQILVNEQRLHGVAGCKWEGGEERETAELIGDARERLFPWVLPAG